MTWYIIRSASGRERAALESLQEVRLDAYLPCETRWRRTSKIKEKAQHPLFAGYLFVQCEPRDFAPILDLDGVHQFVRYMRADGAPVPMPIPAREVEKVRAQEAAGMYDVTRPSARERKRQEARAKAMRKGEAVRLIDGPFSGFIGRVIEMRASDRTALVDVEIFGRQIPVELPSEHLDAA